MLYLQWIHSYLQEMNSANNVTKFEEFQEEVQMLT